MSPAPKDVAVGGQDTPILGDHAMDVRCNPRVAIRAVASHSALGGLLRAARQIGPNYPVSDYRETRSRWESTALTAEDIISLSDADLDDWLWMRLCGVVDGSAASIAALPEPQRAYYSTRLFEWEVMNGGLHQYFFNHPEPELLDLVLDGYCLLRLDTQAAVVREVVPAGGA